MSAGRSSWRTRYGRTQRCRKTLEVTPAVKRRPTVLNRRLFAAQSLEDLPALGLPACNLHGIGDGTRARKFDAQNTCAHVVFVFPGGPQRRGKFALADKCRRTYAGLNVSRVSGQYSSWLQDEISRSRQARHPTLRARAGARRSPVQQTFQGQESQRWLSPLVTKRRSRWPYGGPNNEVVTGVSSPVIDRATREAPAKSTKW